MPLDCGIWCLLSERRRHVERLWRLQTIQSLDEKRARRRFNRLMRAFDTEDLAAILKIVVPGRDSLSAIVRSIKESSGGRDIKQCAPGPPMDIVEDLPGCSKDNEMEVDDDEGLPEQKYEDTGLIPQIDKPMSMPYLCCKLWRWKELQVDAALHRLNPLPWCRFGRVTMNNATVSCCNPYHYALWIVADPVMNSEEQSLSGINGLFPLAEHSLVITNDTGFGDELTATSFANNVLPPHAPPPIPDSPTVPAVSPSSHISPAFNPRGSVWAHMYRWQKKERMDNHGVSLRGQFIAVGLLANSVHDGQNDCTEWDVANEASFALIRQVDAQQTFDEVWLYNSGNKPLFFSVSSSSTSQKSGTIRRLSPGYCYRVHKFVLPISSNQNAIRSHKDPANTACFLNISVGKGWGSNYHRINHTDTPCRYEIIFVPDLL
ncbi:unnamed protein product [Dracunculus medinensis]|uniref:Mothers against decapentaplegic homolog n=1 Tax=Dracunculus medinensis TaxID=318479 RepID=A0A0N4U5L5_DRAME|nr:unnamed protein product [Dracunculus medinensis]